jgi:hypothetical protein
MSVTDWNATPDANATINGINVAENCPAANVNNAIRAIMGSVRVMYDNLPNTSTYVLNTGGVFTGNPTFSGRGGYVYYNDSSQPGGRVFQQPAGGSAPAGMVNGDRLEEY